LRIIRKAGDCQHLSLWTQASADRNLPTVDNRAELAQDLYMEGRTPRYLTQFIGRKREVEEIRRLLTLTCPGRSGKTRLAVEVATHLEEEFRDGIWFFELGELTDPALVPQALLSALGMRAAPAQTALDAFLFFR
jgi:hypothetical protein